MTSTLDCTSSKRRTHDIRYSRHGGSAATKSPIARTGANTRNTAGPSSIDLTSMTSPPASCSPCRGTRPTPLPALRGCPRDRCRGPVRLPLAREESGLTRCIEGHHGFITRRVQREAHVLRLTPASVVEADTAEEVEPPHALVAVGREHEEPSVRTQHWTLLLSRVLIRLPKLSGSDHVPSGRSTVRYKSRPPHRLDGRKRTRVRGRQTAQSWTSPNAGSQSDTRGFSSIPTPTGSFLGHLPDGPSLPLALVDQQAFPHPRGRPPWSCPFHGCPIRLPWDGTNLDPSEGTEDSPPSSCRPHRLTTIGCEIEGFSIRRQHGSVVRASTVEPPSS